MKKIIQSLSLFIAIVVLSACAQGATSSSTTTTAKENADTKVVEETKKDSGTTTAAEETEASGERVTLTYWTSFENNAQKSVSSYSEIPMYKEMMERLNINVEFQHPPVGMEEEQFKLLVASKNLPDIIEYEWLNKYPQGPEKAMEDQVIIPLNEYFNSDKTPYLSAVLAAKPDVDRDIKTYAGNYYVFPFLRADDLMEQRGSGPTIRKDLLAEADLDIPVTIEDWEEMLIAFKDMGIATPFSGADFIPNLHRDDQTFVGAFGIGYNFYHIDGEVYFGQIQPEFKDYLELLNRWYSMGLIDPDIVTNKSSDLDAVMTSGRAAATNKSPDSGIGVWSTTMQKTDPNIMFVAAPYPKLNEADTRYYVTPNRRYIGNYSGAITTTCKEIDAALKWLDYGYSEEGDLLMNFGIEGESFEFIDGEPQFTDLIKANADGLTLKEAMILYCRNSSGGPFQKGAGAINSQRTFDEQREAPYLWNGSIDYSRLLPNLALSSEEAAEYADIMNEVNVLSEEMVVKIMIGDRSVDDFESYVENMKKANIDRAVEISQTAYDRYLNY